MRKILTGLMILMVTAVWAVPARRVTKRIRLADGTEKLAVLRGDEFGHYLLAQDGKAYREVEGSYEEVVRQEVEERAKVRRMERNSVRARRQASTRSASFAPANTGQKRGLVMLVNFSDRKMTLTQKQFDDYFNLPGYKEYGMQGSVHDYFYDCSYGQFDLEFDVVGPFTASNQMQYYGKNDASDNDMHVGELVCEMVEAAYESGVDFTPYDWDQDGYVDQVFLIYAGFGENAGAPSTTIWPHEYDLASCKYFGDGTGPVKCGDVTVNTYACSCELYGTSGKTVDGIGTACHEFSHCLGLPDFYDTRGGLTLNFGMDAWSLMDYGNYCDDGYCPTGYTSYERWFCGWLEPTVLSESCEVKALQNINDHPEAYLIYNDNNHNEYYLLENRQMVGWNSHDYGHGMLVLHVDYSRSAWQQNVVNNTPTRQRMTIIPADNSTTDTNSSLAGDPWPGTTGNNALGNNTTPAAKLYNYNTNGKRLLNHELTEITEHPAEGTISFIFDDPALALERFESNTQDATTYNLLGQKLAQKAATRGIVVRGGRKRRE